VGKYYLFAELWNKIGVGLHLVREIPHSPGLLLDRRIVTLMLPSCGETSVKHTRLYHTMNSIAIIYRTIFLAELFVLRTAT